MTFFDNSFLMFGGHSGRSLNGIAKFDMKDLSWSKIGHLYKARHAHSVIAVEDQFLILGGHGTNIAEKCRYWRGKLTCSPQEPTLAEYRYSVGLFLVPDNFGKYGYC